MQYHPRASSKCVLYSDWSGSGEDGSGEEDSAEEDSAGEEDGEEEDGESGNESSGSGSDSSDSGADVCPICLSRFKGQEVGNPESCDHNFCLDHILEWAKVSVTHCHITVTHAGFCC